MKIAYVLGENLDKHPGLRNKVLGQVEVWERFEHKVWLVAHALGTVTNTSGDVALRDQAIADRDYATLDSYNNLYRLHLLGSQYQFLRKSLEYIRPDIVYGRYIFPYFGVYEGYSAGGKYVIEINSNDLIEYYLKSWVTGTYNKLLRKRLLKRAAGLVFVTRELSIAKSFGWYKGKRVVISNGIDVEEFPFLEETRNPEPNLCFIGSANQAWHGLEKLSLIGKALPECKLHVIGPSREEYERRGGESLPNLIFHGYLNDNVSKQLIMHMDMGISTLSLYEKDMDEACPLKTRQYLAQGVPVIGGYRDSDIENEDFFLQLPNTVKNIEESIGRIIAFVRLAFGSAELRRRAHQFAYHKLNAENKEKQRLAFFDDIVSTGR